MSQPPSSPDADGSCAPDPEIAFDPRAVLDRDSRMLLDPAFLATLHAELAQELPPEAATVALLQIGFLHGLQDVTRAMGRTAALRGAEAGMPLAAPLRMRCWPRPSDELPGALVVEGAWPDAQEVSAHLSALGTDAPTVCFLSAGYTSGWLSGAFGADVLCVETACGASGSTPCRFIARELEDWRRRGEPGTLQLEAIPFSAFRALVAERGPDTETASAEDDAPPRGRSRSAAPRSDDRPAPDAGGMDRDAAVVHIWGPVMVIPYAGPDETLQALELLGRDPGASEVSVIVVDLAGAIVDDAFGAMALEQLVQTADAWAAETLFAEPSPLSERVVAELEHPPLLVLKDLDHAVALAFQIARSQRRLV